MKRGVEDMQDLPYATGRGTDRCEDGLLGGLLEQRTGGLIGSQETKDVGRHVESEVV